jgi:hypothetical protein
MEAQPRIPQAEARLRTRAGTGPDRAPPRERRRRHPPHLQARRLGNRPPERLRPRLQGRLEAYGCRRASGKRTFLYEAYDDDYTSSAFWGDVRLNGRFVAWSWGTYDISCKADCPPGYNPRNSGISVFDLRRRRGRTVTPTNPVGGALVVSRGGGLAWLTRGPSGGPADLHVSLRLSDDRVIDSGDIDPKSLRVELTIISWVRDGVERFVRLR